MAVSNVPQLVDKKGGAIQLETQWSNDKKKVSKSKGLVAEIYNWDEEDVSSNDAEVQVKVPTALDDDELIVSINHARNGEWFDITMRKVNILLSMDEDAD
ncbi:hypothetical protein Tco_1210217 [Tanacetum coccineum]